MNSSYYFLYYFFDSPLIRWVRVGAFFVVGIIVSQSLSQPAFIIQLLPLYFLLLLQELFIHFKLENRFPEKSLNQSYKHAIECVDFRVRAALERHIKIEKVIRGITSTSEVKYFNKLLGSSVAKSEIEIKEIDLIEKAKDIVIRLSGSYIHGVDLYAAYLLLLDKNDKTLFHQGITENDVLVVLSWVRKQFHLDTKKHTGLYFSGSGVFDFFIFGWSSQLARYATNFTREVLSRKRSEPIGRMREYDLMITALSKSSASNALLLGKAGVGKTSLVSQLVIDSNAGMLPSPLSHKIVFKFFGEQLMAGVTSEGELEERFVSLFSELSHTGNIVVYIPNIENIFGGGGINIDMSGVLSEYLKSSSIKIIGSTTLEAYHTYIYPKQEVRELFDSIEVSEPDLESAIFMVMEKAKELSGIYKIFISYSAVKACCDLSGQYMTDGSAMPGRAIKLLDDVLSYYKTHGERSITSKEVEVFIQTKTGVVLSEPTDEEGQKLLNLEAEIHKRIISQDEAVGAISDAMRRVRSGMKEEQKPIASFLFLGPTGVGKTETAKALASCYFGDENAMIRLDMSEYQNPDSVERLLGKNSGQYQTTIVDKIASNPFSLILLDEFEKAYPPILNLFLQVLDEGRLTDNQGRTISFSNTIIIATSNAGSEFIREAYAGGAQQSNVKEALIEKIQQQNIFKPELLNRFDDIIVFKPLSEGEAVRVVKLFLDEVIEKTREQQIELVYDEAVASFIATRSYSVEFGARNLRRFVEQSVENQLSKLILSKKLERGGKALITVENESLVIKPSIPYS